MILALEPKIRLDRRVTLQFACYLMLLTNGKKKYTSVNDKKKCVSIFKVKFCT